jgi:hypothetical protein
MEEVLLRLLIEKARRLDAPDWVVWDHAWQARVSQGNMRTAVPVGSFLTSAIIAVAREKDFRAALMGAPKTPRKVFELAVKRARQNEELVAATAGAVLSQYDNGEGSGFSDPYTIDEGLFDELLVAIYENPLSMPDAFTTAWERRSRYRPWPIILPDQLYLAAIMAAGRLSFLYYKNKRDKEVMRNFAKAEYLFNLLGGSRVRIEAGSGFIETALRDELLEFVKGKAPKNWTTLVDEAGALTSPGGRAGAQPAGTQRGVSKPVQLLHQAVSAVANPAWEYARRKRDEQWLLPWPPSPLPDRPFLLSLIAAAWTYPRMPAADLVQIAAVQMGRLRRQESGELGVLRQAELVSAGFAIGIAVGAILSVGIGFTYYCLSGGCVTIAGGLRKAFASPDEEEPLSPGESGRPGANDEPGTTKDDDDPEPPQPKPPRPKPLPPGTLPGSPTDTWGLPDWWNPTPVDPLPGPGGRPVDRGPKSPFRNFPDTAVPEAVVPGGACSPSLFQFQRWSQETPHQQGACIVIRVPTGRVGWVYSCELMFTYPEVHFKGRNAGPSLAASAAALGSNSCFYSLVSTRQFTCPSFRTCIQAAMLASGFVGARVQNKCMIPVPLTYCPPLH